MISSLSMQDLDDYVCVRHFYLGVVVVRMLNWGRSYVSRGGGSSHT